MMETEQMAAEAKKLVVAPGPWRPDPEFGDECVLGGDGVLVADCSILHMSKRSNEMNKAHARLTAAAPELYAALLDTIRMLEAVRYTVGLGKGQLDRIQTAHAAIRKAEGR